MTQFPIGVGIVGTGFGRKIHIPGFQAHPRTQLAAVYHRDLDSARAIAAEHDIPEAYDTVDALASSPNVQAVSISTPPFLHYEMARTVINSGRHLLLEKPTTLTAQDAEALQDLAQAKGIVTCLDFEFRYVPAWQRLAELLKEGFVGRPRLVKIDWLVPGRANPERAWNWYAQKDLGGGVLGAVGSHALDYVTWLFGPVERLCAHLSTSIAQRPDPETETLKPVDSDDVCQIMLELGDGIPVHAVFSAATYAGRGHWVEVYGDRGTVVLGSDNLKDYVHGFRLWAAEAGQPLQEIEIPSRLRFGHVYPDGRLAPFIRVVDHWINDIDQGQSTSPSLVEGLHTQKLMDLVHRSNQSRTWVEVD
ncbi:MAG: Gfo/Idh/MocA family protein [Elainellaceae cyanobacterium]